MNQSEILGTSTSKNVTDIGKNRHKRGRFGPGTFPPRFSATQVRDVRTTYVLATLDQLKKDPRYLPPEFVGNEKWKKPQKSG